MNEASDHVFGLVIYRDVALSIIRNSLLCNLHESGANLCRVQLAQREGEKGEKAELPALPCPTLAEHTLEIRLASSLHRTPFLIDPSRSSVSALSRPAGDAQLFEALFGKLHVSRRRPSTDTIQSCRRVSRVAHTANQNVRRNRAIHPAMPKGSNSYCVSCLFGQVGVKVRGCGAEVRWVRVRLLPAARRRSA